MRERARDVCLCVRERMCGGFEKECVCERDNVYVGEREGVAVCVRERKRAYVRLREYMYVSTRKRRLGVCM